MIRIGNKKKKIEKCEEKQRRKKVRPFSLSTYIDRRDDDIIFVFCIFGLSIKPKRNSQAIKICFEKKKNSEKYTIFISNEYLLCGVSLPAVDLKYVDLLLLRVFSVCHFQNNNKILVENFRRIYG